MKKEKVRENQNKFGSIQWVIDALDSHVVQTRFRENHKTDEIRADEDLWWCPECRKKWNIFEGELWKSSDMKLWEAKICPDCDLLVK